MLGKFSLFLISVFLTFIAPKFILAQEFEFLLTPGRIEGSGVYFEIKDSKYLNIALNSSENVNLTLESIPEMVTLRIESASGASLTQITLGGFLPQTTYHKYEDNYHNHIAFTTDANGSYSYAQDLSMPHLVFIQPRASTKFIRDDEKGGDCDLIGIWSTSTKTCTLTTDLTETIQIDLYNITLDGNNHTITGSNTGNGILSPERSGVIIKNLNVKEFTYGIYVYAAGGNTLADNNVSNNYYGIQLQASSGNVLSPPQRNQYYICQTGQRSWIKIKYYSSQNKNNKHNYDKSIHHRS